jgi:hypothetical protein
MKKMLFWALAAGCCASSFATDARVITMDVMMLSSWMKRVFL